MADLNVGATPAVGRLRRGASGCDRSDDFAEILKPRPGDWPTYHGRLDGNRHSALAQITTANVQQPVAAVDSLGARLRQRDDAARARRHHVHHRDQSGVGDRRDDGPRDLALLAAALDRAARRCRDRFQPRRRGARLARVSRHRQRASHCRQPRERRAAVGSRAAGEHASSPTAARWRRSSSAISSSPACRAATKAFAGSSPPTASTPASRHGASGPFPRAASPAPKRGRAASISKRAAARRG